MRTVTRAAAIAILLAFASTASARQLPRLKVSENKRFLVTADGQPFFWLGDTAWELFHRLTREDAERYLRNRAERRFTVIQAVVARRVRRPERRRTRTDTRRSGTTIRRSPNEDYFDARGLDRRSAPMPLGPLCRHAPDLGRQVEPARGRRARRSSRRRTPSVRRMAGQALPRRAASSGSSAATVRSKATRTGTSSRAMARGLRAAMAART